MSFFDDDEPEAQVEPTPQNRPEWLGPNEGVLPVLSAQQAVLLKSKKFALIVDQLLVYPNGVQFRILLHHRQPDLARESPVRWPFGGPDAVHYGCELGDGTKWSNSDPSLRPDTEIDGPVVSGGAGAGGMWTSSASHWIWPLPPPGKITFVAEWPSQRLSRQSAEIDADELRDLSASAEVLWPS
jgi:hypothetical protein